MERRNQAAEIIISTVPFRRPEGPHITSVLRPLERGHINIAQGDEFNLCRHGWPSAPFHQVENTHFRGMPGVLASRAQKQRPSG
jgi:hypothetical protein